MDTRGNVCGCSRYAARGARRLERAGKTSWLGQGICCFAVEVCGLVCGSPGCICCCFLVLLGLRDLFFIFYFLFYFFLYSLRASISIRTATPPRLPRPPARR
ncbi:unnamed protein product, partial [Pylaiella littoralis]